MKQLIMTLLVFCSVPVFAVDNSGGMSDDDMNTYPSDAIRITVAHNGSITLNDNEIDLEILKSFFAENPKNPDNLVLIICDEKVSSSDVIKILDICTNYKYNNVQLIYQPSWLEG